MFGPATSSARILVSLLQSLALKNHSLKEILNELSIGLTVAQDLTVCFSEEELVTYALPARYSLDAAVAREMEDAVHAIFRSVAAYLDLGEEVDAEGVISGIKGLHEAIYSKETEIAETGKTIRRLADEIGKERQGMEYQLSAAQKRFAAFDASRSASVDLLAAAIENSLVRLSLLQAQTDRSVYRHGSRNGGEVSLALEQGFRVLKDEEREMQDAIRLLDARLGEYESMLMLIDGGGYLDIVREWTRVKQDTDECRRDLVRLS